MGSFGVLDLLTDAPAVPAERVEVGPAADIAEKLRVQIQNSELEAGQWLREARLCEEFGVGRSVIRRALGILADDGMVVLEQNRGARIVAATPQEVFDLFELRAGLYSVAARFACRRGTQRLIADIVAMIDGLLQNADAGATVQALIEQSERIFTAMASVASADTQRMIAQVRRKTRWHFSYVALEEVMPGAGPFNFWRLVKKGLEERDVALASQAAQDVILYMQGEVSRLMLARGLGI